MKWRLIMTSGFPTFEPRVYAADVAGIGFRVEKHGSGWVATTDRPNRVRDVLGAMSDLDGAKGLVRVELARLREEIGRAIIEDSTKEVTA